tara:strand:- start:8752 stop:9084 length:333 start_codon:yes stop_codon:yes gene_type:complete
MPKEYKIQQPLTPQEKNIASRYGVDNWATNAFYNNQGLSNDSGLFTSTHYQNQDELSGKKHNKIGGDERNTHMDYRRQQQRAAAHAAFNYGSPFGGASGALHHIRWNPPI